MALNSSPTVEELLEKSRLDVVIAKSDSLDWKSVASRIGGEETGDVLFEAEQRQSLYLGVSDVLDMPARPELILIPEDEIIQALLNKTELTVESVAVGTSRHPQEDKAGNQQPAPIKDTVEIRHVQKQTVPIVSTHQPHGKGRGLTAIVWQLMMHIGRQRIRSHNPSIYFAATLKFQSDPPKATSDLDDDFMEPFVPESINLLESLTLSPALRKNPPVLTAARLSKVLPQKQPQESAIKLLRNASRHLIRLIPAINTRTRFNRVGASPSQAKVLAAIDIDVAPWLSSPVTLELIDIAVSDGRAQSLTGTAIAFPQTRSPRDALTLVYNILPNHLYGLDSSTPVSTMHTLSLTLTATVDSHPLKISWRAPIDLAPLHTRPTLLAPAPTQPASRPTTASSHARNSSEARRAPADNHAITLTVTGPPGGRVKVNSTLRWSILLANRSPRVLQLALIPITSLASVPAESISRAQQSAAEARKTHKHRPTLSTSLFRPVAEAARRSTADGGEDDDIGLIPLTADLRVGPLLPGQCATAEMRFLVLRAGVVRVQAVRIVDLEGEGEGEAWREGAKVESGARRARSWVDVGEGFLPDVIGVAEDEEDEAVA